MRTSFQIFFLTASLIPFGQSLFAHDFEANGIYYNITSAEDLTVEVTYETNYNSYSGTVVIPATVENGGNTYSVTGIGKDAFYKCTGLTSIEIPSGVTSIGEGAFYDCKGLTSIEIPSGVTSIDNSAFGDCIGLTSIVIPSGVTSIGHSAFWGCENLKKVYNCSSLTLTKGSSDDGYVACYAWAVYNNCQFDGDYVITYVNDLPYVCGYLGQETELTLPATYDIGDLAFYGCSGLTSIVIPDDMESIGDYAFCDCTSLTSIEMPDYVFSIGEGAFYGCSGLTKIEIPSSVESIGNVAFCGCTGLTSIEIPNSVESIGVLAFEGCTGTLIINCDIEDYEVTGGVIGPFWSDGAQFSEVILGEEVNKVGQYAFSGVHSMKSLTIGSNVNDIGSYAFDGCTGLTSIYCNAINPPACSFGVFDMNTQKNCTLYVPSGSVDAYKAANVWKDFVNIQDISTGIGQIETEAPSAKTFIDLTGRKVITLRHGQVYLQDGKTVLIR